MLDDAAVFVKVVECGNFSSAARELGTTPSSVSKRIIRLEEKLECTLLYRNTRSVRMSAQGEAYYAIVRQALEKAVEAEQAVRDLSTHMQGVIRVAAGPSFTSHVLAPAIAAFVNEHPDISLHLSVRTNPISAATEGADVMFQWGELKDSGLIAKHIMTDELLAVCSPEYFDQHKLADAKPEEVLSHWISPTDNYAPVSVFSQPPEDRSFGFRQVVVDDIEAVLAIVIAGAGVTFLPRFSVRECLEKGTLVDIPSAGPPQSLEGYAVFHTPPSQNPRISEFMRFVTQTIEERHPI